MMVSSLKSLQWFVLTWISSMFSIANSDTFDDVICSSNNAKWTSACGGSANPLILSASYGRDTTRQCSQSASRSRYCGFTEVTSAVHDKFGCLGMDRCEIVGALLSTSLHHTNRFCRLYSYLIVTYMCVQKETPDICDSDGSPSLQMSNSGIIFTTRDVVPPGMHTCHKRLYFPSSIISIKVIRMTSYLDVCVIQNKLYIQYLPHSVCNDPTTTFGQFEFFDFVDVYYQPEWYPHQGSPIFVISYQTNPYTAVSTTSTTPSTPQPQYWTTLPPHPVDRMSQEQGSDSLSTDTIIGIVLGAGSCVVLVIFAIIMIECFCRGEKKGKRTRMGDILRMRRRQGGRVTERNVYGQAPDILASTAEVERSGQTAGSAGQAVERLDQTAERPRVIVERPGLTLERRQPWPSQLLIDPRLIIVPPHEHHNDDTSEVTHVTRDDPAPRNSIINKRRMPTPTPSISEADPNIYVNEQDTLPNAIEQNTLGNTYANAACFQPPPPRRTMAESNSRKQTPVNKIDNVSNDCPDGAVSSLNNQIESAKFNYNHKNESVQQHNRGPTIYTNEAPQSPLQYSSDSSDSEPDFYSMENLAKMRNSKLKSLKDRDRNKLSSVGLNTDSPPEK